MLVQLIKHASFYTGLIKNNLQLAKDVLAQLIKRAGLIKNIKIKMSKYQNTKISKHQNMEKWRGR
jgi:hypothetical protein